MAVAASVHYACTGCGRSCRDFDEVPIDVTTAYRIRSLPLFNPRLRDAGFGLPHRPSRVQQSQLVPGAFTLAKAPHDDGGERCVFLDDDRLCALHLAHGADAKPSTCRVFPLLFTRTPDGFDAGVSFACTAVLQDYGPALADQRKELDLALTLAAEVPELGVEVCLAPGQTIAWARYRELEAELIACVASAEGVAGALAAASRRLGFPGGRPSPRLRTRVLAWYCALQPALLAGLPAPEVGGTRLELPALARHRAVRLEPMTGSAITLLGRYLRHRLERKDLLRWPDLRLAFGALLLELALVDLYAAAIAAPASPEVAHVAEAIRAVEERFVVHSGLRDQIRTDPPAMVRLRRIVVSPRFVASLTSGCLS